MRVIKSTEGRVKWNLGSLKKGQSILVKDMDKFASARSVASSYGLQNGKRFTVRTGASGLKIKRVA